MSLHDKVLKAFHDNPNQHAAADAVIALVVEECAKVAETCWTEFSPKPEQAVLNDRRAVVAAIRALKEQK